jgi:hypothetical protein
MGVWSLFLAFLAGARRKWKSICALPLIAAGACAHAEDQPLARDDRWNLTGNGLWVRNSIDADEMDTRLLREGYATQTDMSGFTRFGYSLSGAYRYKHVAFDLAYVDLGKVTTTIHGNTPLSPEYLRAISEAHPRSGKGPQASVLGFLPINEKWEVTGRMGLFRWSNSITTIDRGSGEFDHIKVGSTDPMLGLGLRYTNNERWRTSLEWSRYRLDGETLNSVSLGVLYRLGKPRDQ